MFTQLMDSIPIEMGDKFKSFVSGDMDPQRYMLKYFMHESSGTVFAEVTFGPEAQGPPNHAHGGAIAAIFDELMGVCCWVNGYPAMTAQYTTSFISPVPLHKALLFSAKVEKIENNKIILKSEVSDEKEIPYAEAEGLFIKKDLSTFEQMRKANPGSITGSEGFESIKVSREE